MTTYQDFIASKLAIRAPSGFDPPRLSSHLFPFQADAVRRACNAGQFGLYEDCGLGKGPQILEWAHRCVEHSGRPAIVLAPLAVAGQLVREGQKFNTPVHYARNQDEAKEHDVVVTNYERLSAFSRESFGAVACDESGILRAYEGSMRHAITDFCAVAPFVLLASATPSPNDNMELGTQVEALRVMTSHEMLARWFINDTSTMGRYRLKGHAVESFWDFMASIAVCIGRPSDLGPYSDDGYVLPPCEEHVRVLDVDQRGTVEDIDRSGQMSLLRMGGLSATNVHREKRITLADRAAKVAEIVTSEPGEQWLCWVDTNYEDDALRARLGAVSAESASRGAKLGGAWPRAASVRGNDSLDAKERALLAFVDGSIRVLITKGSIAGFGLNLQNAARMCDVGVNFSFDSLYQRRRRMWRFGQTRTVHHHIVMAATETAVWQTVQRKAQAHEAMRREMFSAMRRAVERQDHSARQYRPTHWGRLPAWLPGAVESGATEERSAA